MAVKIMTCTLLVEKGIRWQCLSFESNSYVLLDSFLSKMYGLSDVRNNYHDIYCNQRPIKLGSKAGIFSSLLICFLPSKY